MSNAAVMPSVRTPKHLWIIGVIAVLWNAIGALDYVMTETRNADYMSGFTPEQLEFFYGLPAWVVACWAIAVWGALLGSVLLLCRRRSAVWVFIASLLGLSLTSIHNFLLANGAEVMGDAFSIVLTGAIWVIAICLLVYSRAMQRRGVLR